jgi:serine/threonine protein kinase
VTASNVMIATDGHVKLMNVGIAHAIADPAASAATPGDVPSRTMLLGTPVYVAPEVLQGGASTSLSDLYGVGVVLYRLVTGTLPFPERMTQASLVEMLTQPPVPPGLFVAGLPQPVERAIMLLLEKQPGSRFPSAESLAATLSLADRVGS